MTKVHFLELIPQENEKRKSEYFSGRETKYSWMMCLKLKGNI